jgi:hypothetical protein
MVRRRRASDHVQTLFGGATPARPVEALVLDPRGLVRILDWHCQDLHEQRRRVAGTPAEMDTVRQAKYWAEVLSWIKCQYAADLIVTGRTT